MLHKILTWLKDHVALIAGAVILFILIVTMSATHSDYASFAKILESTKKHYAKNESEIALANDSDTNRITKAVEKRNKTIAAADKIQQNDNNKLIDHQKKIESETHENLKKNRQKVADDIAKDLGL